MAVNKLIVVVVVVLVVCYLENSAKALDVSREPSATRGDRGGGDRGGGASGRRANQNLNAGPSRTRSALGAEPAKNPARKPAPGRAYPDDVADVAASDEQDVDGIARGRTQSSPVVRPGAKGGSQRGTPVNRAGEGASDADAEVGTSGSLKGTGGARGIESSRPMSTRVRQLSQGGSQRSTPGGRASAGARDPQGDKAAAAAADDDDDDDYDSTKGSGSSKESESGGSRSSGDRPGSQSGPQRRGRGGAGIEGGRDDAGRDRTGGQTLVKPRPQVSSVGSSGRSGTSGGRAGSGGN